MDFNWEILLIEKGQSQIAFVQWNCGLAHEACYTNTRTRLQRRSHKQYKIIGCANAR